MNKVSLSSIFSDSYIVQYFLYIMMKLMYYVWAMNYFCWNYNFIMFSIFINAERRKKKACFISWLDKMCALQFGFLVDRRVRSFAFPALAFILLYSKLPHKVQQLDYEIRRLIWVCYQTSSCTNIILMDIAGASFYSKFSSNIQLVSFGCM